MHLQGTPLRHHERPVTKCPRPPRPTETLFRIQNGGFYRGNKDQSASAGQGGRSCRCVSPDGVLIQENSFGIEQIYLDDQRTENLGAS